MLKKVPLLFAFGIAGMLHSAETFTFEVRPSEMYDIALNEEERAAGDHMWMRRRDGGIVGSHHAKGPASTTIKIPASGEYFLWVNYQTSQNRRRSFAIHLGEQEVIFVAEAYGEETHTEGERDARGFLWTREALNLEAGDITLLLLTNPRIPYVTQKPAPLNPPLVRGILITNNPDYTPPVPSPENQ